MAGACAWTQFQISRNEVMFSSIRPRSFPQTSLCGIESVKKNTVQSEVSHKHEIPVCLNPVSVGGLLAFLIGTEGARVFNIGRMLAEFAVGEDWEDDYVAGSVVGDEKKFAGFVEGEVTRIFASSRKFV